MKKFFKDFKAFITRGNIVDMAIGVIVASAFTAIVTALTDKILMPCINYLLQLVGGDGLQSSYTFLSKILLEDGTIDWDNSIYIDWGSFISAIINFILVALVLFIVLRVVMNASNRFKKTIEGEPTKAERKELKAQGVNMKDHKEVLKATAELREKNKTPLPAPKPTTDELLTQILEEIKKQNPSAEVADKSNETVSETPKKSKAK